MKKIILILLIAFSFSSCEKDDICDPATVTTPRLVIEFYDNSSATANTKAVTNLKAVAEGMTEGVVFNTSLPSTDASRYLANSTKIFLPLYTPGINSETTTQYYLTNNFNGTSQNTDILTYNYTTNTVFVSRACGYKSLFYLNATNPIVQTEPTLSDGAWIKNIIIVKSNIEDEYEVHIKIYI